MPWVGGIYRKGNYASNGWTGDAANNIGIEAGRHDAQDDDFTNGINQCLNKDGSNAVTGNLNFGGSYKLTNLAPGTASTDSATYGQITSAVTTVTLPAGIISMFGGSTAPSGYLMCDGAAVSRTSYASLFTAIGTAYGAGDGTTTFNVPDLRQRFPLGKNASGTGTGASLGESGGAIDHTHTSAAHSHTVYAHTHGHSLAVDISHTHASSSVSGSVGGSDGTHGHTTVEGRDTDSGTAPIDNFRMTGGGATLFTSSTLIRDTGSGHGHGFSLTAAGQTLGATSKTITGTIGAGTRNGNVDETTSSVTPGATGSNNPAYLTVNYIIKH